MKNMPPVILLLLLLFSGCQKSVYFLAQAIPESSATKFTHAEKFPQVAKNRTPEEMIKKVGFPAQKVESQSLVLLQAKSVTSRTKVQPASKLIPLKISKPATGKATVQKNQNNPKKQLEGIVSQAFPIVWFIILSAVLGFLLIYFAILSAGQGTGAEGALVFLIIPLAIPWCIIAAKILAPALAISVFGSFLLLFLSIILLLYLIALIAINT